MAKPTRDIGASVRARLLNLARQKGQVLDLMLTRYAIERLLYRLSISQHRDQFVLKGAMLLTTWFDDPHRPTRDLDLLGFGDPNAQRMVTTFREVCTIQADDGVTFDTGQLRVERIREELPYGGLRLRTTATLAGARLVVVIDIGFGDAIEPGLEEIDLPVLLDLPAPHLRAYSRETVIAEKFQAMVALGLANSRMKDFYDIWMLSKHFSFDAERLSGAIAATFRRRTTEVPVELPDALSPVFVQNDVKQRQWAAFIRDLSGDVPPLERVIQELAAFLMPYAHRARSRSG